MTTLESRDEHTHDDWLRTRWELSDARAEINRHHRDFESVRAVLDEMEMLLREGSDIGHDALASLYRRFRNVVG